MKYIITIYKNIYIYIYFFFKLDPGTRAPFGLGLSTGWSGLGLCPTRDRPDQIEWRNSRLATDHEKPLVESDRVAGRRRSALISNEIQRSSISLIPEEQNQQIYNPKRRSTNPKNKSKEQKPKEHPQIQRTKTQRTDPQIHKSIDK